MDVLSPRESVIEKNEKKFAKNERRLRDHLHMLDQNAIRGVTESTDEVAEFRRNEPRT